MNQVFHFKCVSNCGRCCTTPPEMSIVEGLKYYKEFILDGFIRVFPYDSPHAKKLLECGATEFSLNVGRFLNKKYLGIITIRPLFRNSDKFCPKLSGTQCSIYEKRPETCKNVPLSLFHLEKEQNTCLSSWVDKYPCMDKSHPIIWEDGQIINKEINLNFNQWPKLYQDSHEVNSTIIKMLICGDKPFLDIDLIEHYNGYNGILSVGFFLPMLYTAIKYLNLDIFIPEKNELFNSQKLLLKDFISKSLNIKNKMDRDTTNMARKSLSLMDRMPQS